MKLSAAEWQAASSLLDEALDLPVDARLAWVEGLSADHSALRPLLRTLLARQGRLETADFLGQSPPMFQPPGGESPDAATSLAGSTLGPYRLLRELGRGGMGSVWLAERADALIRRPVALKLPHPSLYNEHLAGRFARERDILAALNHRSIARLYDAGISSSGQPFLALEYVEGTPFNEYCDHLRLPIEQRINLFCEVLHAVEYAHGIRVIHRDLKPSNILVTSSGEVRLLDFGIAKLTSEAAQDTELTRLGRAFTVEYAAPEQIARQAVSVETDVYSLGVLLYELLTGIRPYQLSRDSLGALEEAILQQDPRKPSAASITEAGAHARASTAPRLRSRLRGDLDTIALKALRKKTEERYRSASALALDLRRHLNGEPVEARADSVFYRLQKFAGRNKLIVGAASLAVVTLMVGAALAVWQARVARAQAAEARQEARRAQVVQDFLLDIFQANSHLQSDPQKARQTTARQLLDIGASRADTDLKDIPAAQEQVLGTLSDMYEQMGLEQEAAGLQRQRLTAARRAYGDRDLRVVSVLSRYAKSLANGPDRSQIPAVLDQASTILDQLHDQSSLERADILVDYASFYRYSSPGRSRQFADRDVALLQKYHPGTDTLLLALQFAARARTALGEYPAAVSTYQHELAAIGRQVGRDTAWDVAPLAQLAGAEAELLQIREAEQHYRASLALSIRLNGLAHNETLQTQTRLAAFLFATSRREEGLALMRTAWNGFEADPTKKSNSVAGVIYGLYGQLLMDNGELQAAAPLIASELEYTRSLYPESTLLSQALLRQATLDVQLARYAAGESEAQEGLAMWRHVAGSDGEPAMENPFLLQLATVASALGRNAQAREWLGQIHRAKYVAELPLDSAEVRRLILSARAGLSEGKTAEAMTGAKAALSLVQSSTVREYFQALEGEAAAVRDEAERRGDPSSKNSGKR